MPDRLPGGSSPLPPRTPAWRRYLRFWRPDVAADVDDELRFHLDERAASLVGSGLAPDDARVRALEEFGDVETVRATLRSIDQRRERRRARTDRFGALRDDLRHALRALRRAPAYTAAVIATLALGVGANAAIFPVVDQLLFRAPPMLHDPARAHRVYLASPTPDGAGDFYMDVMPYARFVELSRWTTSFERTALAAPSSMRVGVGEEAREMPVGIVSASFFSLFDAPPILGRYFGAQEDAPPSGRAVAVLSWSAWQSRYGGRLDALGATLQIGRVAYTIIGVAPRGFVGVWQDRPPIAYVPYSVVAAANDERNGGETWWTTRTVSSAAMLAERKPGVTLAVANADLTTAMRRSWAAEGGPLSLKPFAIAASILTERGPMQTSVAPVAALVGAMALVVLLIAYANVANLLLARALRRRRELAVRLALGAGRGRLLSHLLTESVLLALLGGIVGLLVAQWGGATLRAAFLPLDADPPVIADARTVIFVGFAALMGGILTGFAGAWQARRVEVTRDLRGGVREGARHRSWVRVTLLVTQGALSALLLIGAGLFVRSLTNARQLHLGFDVTPVSVVGVHAREPGLDSVGIAALRERLLAAARRLPGVEHAALAGDLPLDGAEWIGDLDVPGVDPTLKRRFHQFNRTAVSPDYFATLGTRIVRGRGIGATDVVEAPGAVVVSRALASLLWPSTDAVGQCMKIGDPVRSRRAATQPCTFVVGIAEDVKVNSLGESRGFYYYLSAAQVNPRFTQLVVRTRGDASRESETIRRALQKEMSGASSVTVTPYAEIVGEQLNSWHLGTTMFTAYGLLALALAAVGLYAMIAYDTEQRSHEVGVRIALGARRWDVEWLIVRHGLRLAAFGVAIGCAAAVAMAGRIAPLLFRVSPRDPLVYALVASVMVVVAAIASLVPAWRAARTDPADALRAEW